MTTLIERLEAAEAGSRELDATVAEAAGLVPDNAERMYGHHDGAIWATGPYESWAAPAYTSRPYDLTAAMGLVPEGWRIIRVEFSASGHRTYMHLGKIGTLDTVLGIGSSMSLALTAAALRAKEIEDEQP